MRGPEKCPFGENIQEGTDPYVGLEAKNQNNVFLHAITIFMGVEDGAKIECARKEFSPWVECAWSCLGISWHFCSELTYLMCLVFLSGLK